MEESQLQYIKGIGPVRAEALAAEGILTPGDLVEYFPRDYIDRNSVASLKALSVVLRQDKYKSMMGSGPELKSEVCLLVQIATMREREFGHRRRMLAVTVGDGSGGSAEIVFWNYVDYYQRIYSEGELIIISGRPELNRMGKVTFNHPEIEKFETDEEDGEPAGEILPVYRLTEGLKKARWTMRLLRRAMRNVIDNVAMNMPEILPREILKKFGYPLRGNSVRNLHFPESHKMLDRSLERMKFEEVFFFELFLALRHRGLKVEERGIAMNPKSPRARSLYESLPFKLTGDQMKVIHEISADMSSGKPMNRLLQGDVGSGKTIVALLSILVAVDNGYQTALMAPTEILAEQHFNTLKKFLEGLDVNIVQLLGGQRKKVRNQVKEEIETGNADIIVGTHAMFESQIEYRKLGFIVIDEQHRFGVEQRAKLREMASGSDENGAKVAPHTLVMSATPIPRTLSLTLYGDLDVSVIREKPSGRKPIRTKIVFESNLNEAYNFIREELSKGRQAFIVYPLVEKSDKLDLKSAVERHKIISEEVFPEYSCGLLHGQMLWYEKEDTMRDFLDKKYDVLVATTVIEVGIDVPNATVMLIENAERFGMAQLHQLRGRVGRGDEQSYCMLATKDDYMYKIKRKKIDENERQAAIVRLKTMAETEDGFKISEVDLKLRGPGDVMGTRQSGIPAFKFVSLTADGDIIARARNEAFNLIASDPQLRQKDHASVRRYFLYLYKESKTYFGIA